jgi:hypothetical protein
MLKKLHLSNNDIERQAEPRWMDPDDPGLIVFDWDDAPKNAASFARLPIADEPIDTERVAMVAGQRNPEG